jgi:hypothetical protein
MENSYKHLRDIEAIKQMMERSSRFISLSGWSGISAGFFALLGAGVAYRMMQTYTGRSLETALVLDAIVVLILALVSSVYFSWRKARKQGGTLYTPLTRKLLVHMAIPLVTGGIYSAILLMQGHAHLVTGTTLIFYGLALVNAGRFTNKEAVILGLAELALGIAATAWYAYGFWIWACGFGLFHILYGVTLYRKYDRMPGHE